jgi:hypothetical protein
MMAKPLIHARNSMKRYGGSVDDYLEIHHFMDSTKAALPDVRHRAILHSSFGIFLVERLFGIYLTNTDGKQVSTRSIAEDHVREDLGFIPTMEKWFGTMQIEDWMQGPVVKSKHFIAMENGND